ncbi:MAG: hypothetical protein Q4D19_12365, partial [Lautropia sp.]|nr:hypothetical protein [Lautropia sp.]
MSRQIAWLLRPPPSPSAEPGIGARQSDGGTAGAVAGAATPARKTARSGGRALPSREEVLALPPFDTLPDEAIIMVDPAHAAEAGAEIRGAGVVGFDTESKPV